MSRVMLTVDGVTLLNADLREWRQRERMPEELAALQKPGVSAPWMRPTLLVLTDALVRGQPIAIRVRTSGAGYSFDAGFPEVP